MRSPLCNVFEYLRKFLNVSVFDHIFYWITPSFDLPVNKVKGCVTDTVKVKYWLRDENAD